MMGSCSLTKNINEGDDIYMGTTLKIKDTKNIHSLNHIREDLNLIPQRGTENGIGNFKIGLHNLFAEAENKGIKHWIKYKLGSSPIIYDENIRRSTIAKIRFFLNGKGYFSNDVVCDTLSTERKVNLNCDITLGERYIIDSLIFPNDETYLTLGLDEEAKRNIIKEAEYYDRDKLSYERLRLTTIADQKGFANFNTNNVYFYVDTSHIDKTVDIYTKIIDPTDSTTHIRYTLDSIRIFPNYSLKSSNSDVSKIIPLDSSITVYEKEHYLGHELYNRLILEETGTYYDKISELKTINRIQNMGLFRYINIVNEPTVRDGKGYITQNIYLTPTDMQSISGELEINNRSGNFLGTGASVIYQHKNLFGHAENFNVTISGQVETQFGDGLGFINSSDISVETGISIPGFKVPFTKISENRNYVPRTLTSLNYTRQRRAQFYTAQGLTAKFGYTWRHSARSIHELYPININEYRVFNITSEFQDILNTDPRLNQAFDNRLISGMQYYYTFNDQSNRGDRRYNYFKLELESSGNLLSLFTGANQANPEEIGGLRFAQYVKVTLDYRKYLKIRNADLATRVIIGIGSAYGNSEEVPYIKQYIIGGSNSIRAFRIRGIGPGSFFQAPPQANTLVSQFLDQTGDIKFELNAEYRFPVFKFFKSALFVDAGNVWLLDNDDVPEGNFNFSNIFNELAIGTGIGLRLDFNFFLIRMDIAFPLRAPTQDGFKWLISDINLFERSWRQDNLRYNLGIGYPF